VTADGPRSDPTRRMTLEAFADTIIPGEKRWAGDVTVAGRGTGGGAVAAGAVELLEEPACGLVDVLDSMVAALNEHARDHARRHDLRLDAELPPFVALAFDERTALVQELTSPDQPEKELWVALAIFSTMAFDTGAHLHTAEALAAGHPGLRTVGFEPPDGTGLWRFPEFSYQRALAPLHPDTTPNGSLA
jgi:enediyne biosynthesis protein E8